MSLTLSAIVLGSPEWKPTVVIATSVFLIILALSILRSRMPAPWKLGMFLLKGTAAVLLGLCLLDPQWVSTQFKPGENIVLVLVDNSASMNIRQNSSDPRTRAQWTRELLADPEADWLLRLSQDFDLRRYTFGAQTTHVEGFQDLKYDDPRSHLGTTLATLSGRYAKQPLAAIFLLTDGNTTDEIDVKGLPDGVQVYPIVADDLNQPDDIEIASVNVSQTNFEDAPVSIQARIAATGQLGENVVVTLAPHDGLEGEEVQTQTVTMKPGEESVATFEVKPAQSGALFYRLRVFPEAEGNPFENPELSKEATLVNNERLVAVNRDPHDYRLLYVSGRPNFEHKFLGRALAEDNHLHLVSYVRIAPKEAKFDFRGRAGDNANSMFRGTGLEPSEEIESFDQPVTKRINIRDNTELSDGFPKTKADLYQYEAVILDDIEAAFFTHDQLSLLETYVSERGGALMMLGGLNTFRSGGWENTPIAHALPVYLDRPGGRVTGMLKWDLTREGWLEPWMRIRDNEVSERARLQEVPDLELVNTTREVKPGARVLAEVTDESGQVTPAMVAQQYGRGRVGAVLVGDLWKWSMTRLETDEDDLAKVWRQVSRWLVGDVPKRVEAAAAPDATSVNPGMMVQVRVRGKEFQPQEQTNVTITVRQPDNTAVKLDAQPSLKEPGLFEALHIARQPGPYVARIEAPGDGEEKPLSTEIGWVSDPALEEFDQSGYNSTLMEEIARETGGEFVKANQLPAFVKALPTRELPVMETQSNPIWHRPYLLGAVLVLLGLEWGLRRWRGLA